MHVGLGEVLLILVNQFAHLRAQLLGVGVTPSYVTSKQVASLSRSPLLSAALVDGHNLSFGRGSILAVHVRHQVHLVRVVHELAMVRHSSVHSSNGLGPVLTARHLHILLHVLVAKALDLALRGGSWDLVVVVLRVRHVLLHRSEHGHVEVAVCSGVLHEISAGHGPQLHLLGHFVLVVGSLTVVGSVQNDDSLVLAIVLPVLLMEDWIGLLAYQLHLLVVQLLVLHIKPQIVVVLHSDRLLVAPLVRRHALSDRHVASAHST